MVEDSDAQDTGSSLFSTAPSTPEPSGSPSLPYREAFPFGRYVVHTTASPSLPVTSYLAPQTLRKSVSVDSFVQYPRDEPSSVHGARQSRVNTGSALEPPRNLVFSVSDGLRQERDQFRSERGRITGVTTVISGNHEETVGGDFDVERPNLSPTSTGGFKPQHQLKSHAQPKSFARGVQLPLPSRTPTLSTTSSASSMSAATSSSTEEDLHRLRSTTSMQSMPRRGTVPTTASSGPGRTRSGSLGVSAPGGLRMVINTQLPSYSDSVSSAVTIAVVGAPGCGKSAAIRKGLKGYYLKDPLTFAAASGSKIWSRYSQRVGRISRDENTPDSLLYIVEVDISASSIDPPAPKSVSWPDGIPRVDGVIICYDSSEEASFSPVETLLRGYRALSLPVVVLACKADLKQQVQPTLAAEILHGYDVGLVEVTCTNEAGKDRLRRSFEWLLTGIFRNRSSRGLDTNGRNPASPDFLMRPPWENPRIGMPTATNTPTASSSMSSMRTIAQGQALALQAPIAMSVVPSQRSPDDSDSPARSRLHGEVMEKELNVALNWQPVTGPESKYRDLSTDSLEPADADLVNGGDNAVEEQKGEKEKQSRPAQWATLDELLDKLIFLAVSGDDAAYITHFLLTYRRFATPRSVILAMQKRMRQLDNPSGDPMFACFAQMRICSLLDQWIREYPHDFSVPNTAGALNALTKSIISKTYLLHYGSEFLPFLEMLPNLIDKDATWAMKPDEVGDESECSSDEEDPVSGIESPAASIRFPTSTREPLQPSQPGLTQERNASSPLSARTLGQNSSSDPPQPVQPRQLLKDLAKVAQEVNVTDSEEIARQITLVQAKLFLAIEPRHWLHFTFTPSNKDPAIDTIGRYNAAAERLGQWVVSLILCHDRPKARAKQIEKFVDVAQKLRAHNNYSALRAFVAGINNATFPGDDSHERFKSNAPEQAKNLRSWDVLLQSLASHRAYRLALRNSTGAVIPALEVHMNDLIRANEGNKDSDSKNPSKIHWGKHHLIGRLVGTPTACQAQCRASNEYSFQEKPSIAKLIFEAPVMDEEFQKSRIAPPDFDMDDTYRPTSDPPKGVALLRGLFFW